MISHLRGALLEKHPNRVVVDAHGVGYEVTIPVSAYSSLPDLGAEVRLHIYTHVREDALALFGFVAPADKTVFEKLIAVSGIGPKLAITVLSGLAAEDLAAAIRAGSIEQLVRIPGVGKKTAERMILELRDKLDLAGPPSKPAEAKSAFSTTELGITICSFLADRRKVVSRLVLVTSPTYSPTRIRSPTRKARR